MSAGHAARKVIRIPITETTGGADTPLSECTTLRPDGSPQPPSPVLPQPEGGAPATGAAPGSAKPPSTTTPREPEPDERVSTTSGTLKWNRRLSGTKLGRYRLGVRLGIGGAASVYLGRLAGPHQFERLAAIKIIHEHLLEEPEFVTMFLDEAHLAVRLSHPNIVHVYELGHEGDALFLAMEFLHGQPLSRVYQTLAKHGARLPFDLVAWIGARVAEGLHHAHRLTDEERRPLGLVHRDVSPDNIFITYDGHVKIIDFGVARAMGRITRTALGKIKGKYRYMAPEIVLGKHYDHRVDLFALGATIYEVELGEPLFAGQDDADTLVKIVARPVPDPRERIANFPPALASLVMRALATDPDERFADAATFQRALDAFVVQGRRVDQRERLAGLMTKLFSAQREEEARAIAELRAADAPEEAGSMVQPHQKNGARPSRWWLLAAGLVPTTSALAVITLLSHGGGGPESLGGTRAEPSSVIIDVATSPRVDHSVIQIGEEISRGYSARQRIPRSSEAVEIVVTAPGYRTARVSAAADRDTFLVIPLNENPKRQETGPVVAAPAHEPKRLRSTPPAPAPSPAPAAPESAFAPREAPPAPLQPGGVVVDYPF